MAQFNFAEKINNPDEWADHIPFDEFAIEPTAVMTGDKNIHRFLIYQLKRSMVTARGIDIIVSFLMESGVKMILNDLKNALDRNASIRILTGNYLGIMQPSALYLIKNKHNVSPLFQPRGVQIEALYALAIRENIRPFIKNNAFCAHWKDILDYRTMDYYRRRYRGD